MAFSKATHDQIKNVSKQKFIKALERDGFTLDQQGRASAILVYRHADGRRVNIHWHPRTGFGRNRLKKMLVAAEWTTERDLRRVGLIK